MDAGQIKELVLEEGTVLHVYDDATGFAVVPGYKLIGHPTIGIGRALDVHGITSAESTFLLDDDIAAIGDELKAYSWWKALNSARQFVIVDMAFNCGIAGMLSFHRMIAALGSANFDQAATEMLASHWASQVPTRAHRLAQIMRTGLLPS